MDLLVAAAVLALLPVVVARPFVGAVLYTVLAYLRPHNLVGGVAMSWRLSLLVLAALAAGLVLAIVRGKERPLLRTPWFVLVVAFLLVQLLASRSAFFPALAHAEWMDLCRLLTGVGLTVSLCTDLRRARILLATVALSLGAMAFIALAAPVWDAGRLTGAGGNFRDSNDFALALCIALPLLLCLPRVSPRWTRLAMLIALPAVLVAIVLTQSRGGFLALSALAATWAITTRGRVFKLALAPAAVLAFLALAPGAYLERLTTIRDYHHDSSARDRISSWKVAVRIAEERPFTGAGPGNFLAVYRRYSNDLRSPHVAHNTPLQLVADAGFPALCVFSALFLQGTLGAARLARRARSRRRRARTDEDRSAADALDACATGVSLSLVAFVVGCQFLSVADLDLFYLLAGVAAALGVHARGLRLPAQTAEPARGVVLEGPCASAA